MPHIPSQQIPESSGGHDDREAVRRAVSIDKISPRKWEFAPAKVLENITGKKAHKDQLGRLVVDDDKDKK